MIWVVITSVDAAFAPVIEESLVAAGIAVRITEVKRMSQMALVPRETVDVAVASEKEAAAKSVLAQLELESEEALRAEPQGDENATKSNDDLRIEAERAAAAADEAPARRNFWRIRLLIGGAVLGSLLLLLLLSVVYGPVAPK